MATNNPDDFKTASRTPPFKRVPRVAPEQSPMTPAGKAPDPGPDPQRKSA